VAAPLSWSLIPLLHSWWVPNDCVPCAVQEWHGRSTILR
jgi:hypothetical protein